MSRFVQQIGRQCFILDHAAQAVGPEHMYIRVAGKSLAQPVDHRNLAGSLQYAGWQDEL